jgi:Na+/H+-dicarboxylate symporter
MKLPRMGLSHWVLLALILGILTGLFFGYYTAVLAPIGDAFIKIWQITVLPLVVVSLISGTGSLKAGQAKNIALKTGLVLLMFLAVGTAVFFADNPAPAGNQSLADLFIPSNPFQSL